MSAHLEDQGTYLRITYAHTWPTADQSRDVRAAAGQSSHWCQGGRVLFDLRGVDLHTAPHYETAHSRLADWGALGQSLPRVALLAMPGGLYGVIRMMQELWQGSPLETFVDETAALAWLHLVADTTDREHKSPLLDE